MNQLISFINKREKWLVWLGIALYFIIFSLICIWKYYQFGYNGLDLAIYNQVFFNSAHGQLFNLTIHPHSYLGDHFELFILILLPLYSLFQHPITLLVLQSLMLAISAWPLYLIAKNALPKLWPLFIALLWLLNPLVQNINLFEFHLLPFAIFFLLFAFYFYQKEKFLAFLLSCFLALLVREDVALVILMFSVLAALDKRKIKWIIWPGLMAVGWFIIAMKIIAHFTPSGSYKFFYYYSWLGSDFGEMAKNFFARPLNTFQHLFSPNNLLLSAMLFLPFGFFNFIKPKYLLLALPIYFQMVLGHGANALIILKLHYPSLFLPALFVALIDSLKKLIQGSAAKAKLVVFLKNNLTLVLLILMASALYGFLTLGPVPGVINKLFKPTYAQEIRELKNNLLQEVLRGENVAATYEFLTNLSGRQKIYSLHYAFIGKKQFTDLDYRLPADVETLLFDFDDLLTYGVQFPNSREWQAYYQNGDDNLRKLLEERGLKATKIVDSLAFFEKADQGFELYQIANQFNDIENKENIELDNGVKFLGWTPLATSSLQPPASNLNLLPISLYFQTIQKLDKNYQLKLILKNKNGQIVHEKLYPFVYGLYPTTEWQPNETVKINYWFLIPASLTKGEYQTELALVDFNGFLTLDGIRSAVMKITKETIIAPAIPLTEIMVE